MNGCESEDETCVSESIAAAPAPDRSAGVTSDVPIHLMNQEQLSKASEEKDRILWIREPASVLEPSKRVSKIFAEVFKQDPCAVSQFSKVLESTKRAWYEDWKGHFWWHQGLEDYEVYTIWSKQVSHRYRNIMSEIRQCAEDKRPIFLTPDMFAAIRASGGLARRKISSVDPRLIRRIERLTKHREILTQRLPTPESQPTQQDRGSAASEAAGGVRPDGVVSSFRYYGRQVHSDIPPSSRVQQMNTMVEIMQTTHATEVSRLEAMVAELEQARAADRAALDERLTSIAELLLQRGSHAGSSSLARPQRNRGQR